MRKVDIEALEAATNAVTERIGEGELNRITEEAGQAALGEVIEDLAGRS